LRAAFSREHSVAGSIPALRKIRWFAALATTIAVMEKRQILSLQVTSTIFKEKAKW
jgi:hypothetical protein